MTIFHSPPPLNIPHKKRLRQHLVRRVVLALLLGVFMLLLAQSGIMDVLIDRYSFKPESWYDNTALIQHLRLLITHNGITHAPPECLLFILNGNDPLTASQINVLEKHAPPCPRSQNKPSTIPQILLTLRVDRVHHTIESDQNSPGIFHPISDLIPL